jgi:hypothetical protein
MRNPTRERRTSRLIAACGNWEYWPQDLRLREYPAVNQ